MDRFIIFFIIFWIGSDVCVFSQNLEAYRFSEEIKEELKDSLLTDQKMDSLLWQSAFIHNNSLIRAISERSNVHSSSFLSNVPTERMDLDIFTDEVVEQFANHRIVFLNYTFPSSFSEDFLLILLPQLKQMGVSYLGIDGLEPDSISLSSNTVFRDSLGYPFRLPSHLSFVKEMNKNMTIFSFNRHFFEHQDDVIQEGVRFIRQHPNDKILVLTRFSSFYSKDKNCYSSPLADKVQREIEEAYFVDLQISKMDSSTIQKVLWNDTTSILNTIHSLYFISDKISIPTNDTTNSSRGAFTIPSFRIIEYPVILLKFRKDDFKKGGLPIEVREITHKDQNLTFSIDKGEFTFLFLYTTREMFHLLQVIKTI